MAKLKELNQQVNFVSDQQVKPLYFRRTYHWAFHMYDVEKLVKSIDTLVDGGNTVLVIEHNLDIIKRSDYIIDLGPDGGDNGGELVFRGHL